MSGALWTTEERETLRRLWPRTVYSKLDILEALPGRTWYGVKQQARAQTLGARPFEARLTYDASVNALPIIRELKRRRQVKNLTQEQLSRLTGYGLQTVVDWERGARIPHLRRLLDWCEGLGLELHVREKARR